MKGIPDNIKSYIDEIDSAGTHLLEMINDVLDISGIEHGIFKLSSEVFNTIIMFKEVYETAEYNASQKNQTLHFNLDPGIPSTLIGDEKRLKQIILNLLVNAVKFSPENGEISFSAKVKNREESNITLEFEVKDNGIGIPRESLRKIFTMFSQLRESAAHSQGGLGIGLALVQGIVQLHGGTIEARSEGLGRGSEFTVRLPLAASSNQRSSDTGRGDS